MNSRIPNCWMMKVNNIPIAYVDQEPTDVETDFPKDTVIMSPNGQYKKRSNGRNKDVEIIKYTKTTYTTHNNIDAGDIAYIKTNGKISNQSIDNYEKTEENSKIHGHEILSFEQVNGDYFTLSKVGVNVYITTNNNSPTLIGEYKYGDIEPYNNEMYVFLLDNNNILHIRSSVNLYEDILQIEVNTDSFDTAFYDDEVFIFFPDKSKKDYPSIICVNIDTNESSPIFRVNTKKSSKTAIYKTDDGLLAIYNDDKRGTLMYAVVERGSYKKKYEDTISLDVDSFESCHVDTNFAVIIKNTDQSVSSTVLYSNTGTISKGKLIPTNKYWSQSYVVPFGNCYAVIVSQSSYSSIFFYAIDNMDTMLVYSTSFVDVSTTSGVFKSSENVFYIITNSTDVKITAEPNSFLGVVQSFDNEKKSATLSVSGQVSRVHNNLTPGSPFIVNGVHRGKVVSNKEILLT